MAKRSKNESESNNVPSDNGLTVVAVFKAPMRTEFGPGSTAAVVMGQSGKCRFYGRTTLANANIIGESDKGKDAAALAELLNVPLITGTDAARAFVSDNELTLDTNNKILDADAKTRGWNRRSITF